MKQAPAGKPEEGILFAETLPHPGGGYTVIPKKPLREVASSQAAKLLGVSTRALGNMVNQPLGRELLRWRWTSEKQAKRLFDLQSLVEYREATKDPEFGDKRT